MNSLTGYDHVRLCLLIPQSSMVILSAKRGDIKKKMKPFPKELS